jgi:hypothetical protein
MEAVMESGGKLAAAGSRFGLYVSVLRNARYPDCTGGGVTSKADQVLLVGDGVAKVFEDTGKYPVLRLVRRDFGGRPYFHAEPVDPAPEGAYGPMAGGNFVTSNDGRLDEICGWPAIPVHDRFEKPHRMLKFE